MKDKLLTMSKKELTRLEVMKRLQEKRMKQKEAAKVLGLSVRQVKRLLKRYREAGSAGLVSQRRGKPGNHRLAPEVLSEVRDLLYQHYADFGPTLAHEKLTEKHGLSISRERVRQLLMAEGLWKARRAKRVPVHQLRVRRACRGELIQIDGSPHAWFAERGSKCSLLVYIDDATGELMALHFTPSESTFSYFAATRHYLTQHGRPVAFYSDKHGLFKVNIKNALSGSGMTQFGRALKALEIELICANTPQAKGRLERVNTTLQDRLVKELRLQGIDNMADANAFAPEYIADFNRRFAVQPRSSHDAHRPVLFTEDELELIFSLQKTRTLSKNLTLQYNKVIYQIQTSRPTYALRQAQVTVCENAKGEISIRYKGKPLAFTIFNQQQRQADVVLAKDIDQHLQKPHKPAPDHPWRRYGKKLNSRPLNIP